MGASLEDVAFHMERLSGRRPEVHTKWYKIVMGCRLVYQAPIGNWYVCNADWSGPAKWLGDSNSTAEEIARRALWEVQKHDGLRS